MKLYLNSNIIQGTPEELVTYQELLKERGLESEKSLFHFGHMHQLTEEESSTEEDEEAGLGEFYAVNVENSALPSGTLLKKVDKHTHEDSTGQEYLCVDDKALDHVDKQLYQLEDRFKFATKVGIRLTDTTDLAQATEGEYFKVTKEYSDLSVGDIVTITKDDRDSMPQCKDKYGNFYYLELYHLEPVQDNLESTESSTDEEESPSTELKVGDRVKVLKSENGAVGEATVTAVLEDGSVRLEGKSDNGVYSYKWSNNTANLEKIEEEQSKHKQEIYDYYEVVDPDIFASSVEKGTVLKVIGDTYTLKNKEGNDRDYIDLVTSTGLSQTSPMRDSVIKPIIDNAFIADRFKFAKEAGVVLTVDTDFAEECKGHYFKVTKEETLSNFTPTDILTVRRDDGSNAIAFQDFNNSSQFTLLIDVKEIARPSK